VRPGDEIRCAAVAVCDAGGQPVTAFQVGEFATFFIEFEIDRDIDVPIWGISLVNERNLIVHGKNSLQHDLSPSVVAAGTRLRVRQRMRLDVAPGRYTFIVGLASMPAALYARRADMSHAALDEQTTRLVSVGEAGAFSVALRRDGLELPFHGVADLDGDSMAIDIDQARPEAQA